MITEIFELYGCDRDKPYYNICVGRGTLSGETTEEIVEKAKALINSPHKELRDYMTGQAKTAEPFPLRIDLKMGGQLYSFKKSKPKKRDEMMRGGLDALLGGGSSRTAAEVETVTEPRQEPAPKTAAPAEVIIPGAPEEEDELIASIEDEELKAALIRKRNAKRGRPRLSDEARQRQEDIYVRSCWVMRRDQMAKLKEISFRETLTLREIMAQIVADAIEAYEKKHGEVKPKEHRGDASGLFK